MPLQTISHYELLEPIGRGGMGVVHKARDLKLGRLAALKFLSSDLLPLTDARTRFLREARSLSSLSHPHVATVYEVDEVDGKLFLAMEYLPGGTLRAKVDAARAAGTFIPEAQLLDWAIGRGIRRFDPGAGGSHKRRRGFVAQPRASLHRWSDPGFDRILRRWLPEANDQMLQEIAAINAELPFSRRERPLVVA